MSKFESTNVLKSILVVLLIILVTSLSLALEVQRVEASGTIYIRADGSIDPPTAPISSMDNVTYIFTDDVNETMKVERDNIVVDGAGHGSFVEYSLAGIDLSGRNNVTIMNMRIEGYYWSLAGISLASSSDCTISGTSITTKTLSPVLPPAIYLDNSSNNRMINNTFANNGLLLVSLSYQNDVENNTINDKPLVYLEDISNRTVDDAGQVILVRCNNIEVNSLDLHRTVAAVELIETNWTTVSGNNLTDNNVGIALKSSVNNTISKNNVTENSVGLWIERSSYNIISESSIAQNNYGLFLRNSDQNSIYRNNVTKNGEGIHFDFSGGNCIRENNITENHDCGIGVAGFGAGGSNAIYHNNLVNNTNQDIISFNSTDVWDDAYPSGGNFWSNYTGVMQTLTA